MSISRLLHIPAAELARIKAGTGAWRFRTLVRRPGEGAWTDVSSVAGGDWQEGFQIPPSTPDAPAETFTVLFLARADGRTLSPGMASEPLNRNAADVFAPLLYPGNHLEVWAAYDTAPGANDGTERLWLEGRIGPVAWPENNVACTIYTPDGILNQVQIREEGEERGAPYPGTPLSTEIQENLDAWASWAPPLETIGDPEVGVGPYFTEFEDLGPQLRQWAQEKGWDFRHLPLGTDGRMVPTLYLPPRDKTVPDLEFSTDQILGVPALEVTDSQARAYILIKYQDQATGNIVTVRRVSEYAETQFIPRAMQIKLASGDPASNAISANRLADYAVHDVGDAFTTKKIRIPFNPWLTLHDMIGVDPDDVRFDYVTHWAVLGVGHTVTAEEAISEVDLRGGSPVGQYYSWFARETVDEVAEGYGLVDFREIAPSAAGKRRWGWTRRGSNVTEVWAAYRAFPAPWTDDNWSIVAELTTPIPDDQEWVEIDVPLAGEMGALQVEPRIDRGGVPTVYSDLVVERVQISPVPPNITVDLIAVINAAAVDLSLGLTAAAGSNPYPAVAKVYEGGEDTGTLIAEIVYTTDGVQTRLETAALGGRTIPGYGVQTWAAVVTDRAGNVYRDKVVLGALAAPVFSGVKSVLSVDLLSVDIYGSIDDPNGAGGTMEYWVPTAPAVPTDPILPADPSLQPTGSKILSASDLPFSFGPHNIPAFNGVISAGSTLVIFLKYTTTDGRSTGAQQFTLDSSMQFLVDIFGKLRAGSVYNGLVLAEAYRPYFIGNGLPTLTVEDYGTDRYFDADELQPYLHNGSGWVEDNTTPAISYAPILRAGVVTAEVISAGAVRAKLVGAERLTSENISTWTLDAGQYIRSMDYVAGASGYNITPTDAEFNDVTIRGVLDGATGTFSGNLDLAGGLNSLSFRDTDDSLIARIYSENIGNGLYLSAGAADISLHDFGGVGGDEVVLGTSLVRITGDLTVSGTISGDLSGSVATADYATTAGSASQIEGKDVGYGANDSGGAGYRLVRVANI